MALRVNNLAGFGGGRSPIELSLADKDFDASNLTTYTFSAKSLGLAHSARQLFVLAGGGNVASVSSVTVAGNSTTLDVNVSGTPGGDTSRLVLARVDTDPGGTTGDVVVTFGDTASRCSIAIVRAIKWLNPGAPYDTDSMDNTSLSMNVPARGFSIVGGFGSGAGPSVVSGVTEYWSEVVESAWEHAGGFDAEMSAETGRAFDITGDMLGVCASYSP